MNYVFMHLFDNKVFVIDARCKHKKKYHIKYGNTYAVRESQPLEPAKKIRKIKRHIPHCTVYSAYRISLVWLSELETANSFR